MYLFLFEIQSSSSLGHHFCFLHCLKLRALLCFLKSLSVMLDSFHFTGSVSFIFQTAINVSPARFSHNAESVYRELSLFM